jgi:hydroxymethylpyrimidine pyrophosphatase-like HAD family hydrolase
MRPFSEFPAPLSADIRVVAADVDDTITAKGKLTTATLASLTSLGEAGVAVVLVTGRPAGWAQALAGYLPTVRVAVAENGLVAFAAGGDRVDLGPPRAADFAARLSENAERVRRAYGLAVTPDDTFRLFERAFVRPPGFDAATLVASGKLVDPDFEVMASSIHIHVRPGGFGKAEGLLAAVGRFDPETAAAPDAHILFVGDSSNDRSLFARLRRTSVGDDRPAYVTEAEGAAGFAEVVTALMGARS